MKKEYFNVYINLIYVVEYGKIKGKKCPSQNPYESLSLALNDYETIELEQGYYKSFIVEVWAKDKILSRFVELEEIEEL